MLEKVDFDQKEQNLEKDEKIADVEFELTQTTLDEATKSMQSLIPILSSLLMAINKEDRIGIKLAHEMINSVKRNFTNAQKHIAMNKRKLTKYWLKTKKRNAKINQWF